MKELCPVSKLDRLLLSTDSSEYSEGAIREAIKLAKTCSARLIVAAVVETNPEYEAIAPQLIDKADQETKQSLDSIKEMAVKEGVDCEAIVRHDDEPYKSIVDVAQKNSVDIIIMGRHGRTGLSRLLMGSVTAKVVGHAPCSVLVVPKAADMKYRNILVATDGSKYSAAAASEALGVAKRCGASLTIISVVPSEAASPFDIVHSQMQHDLVAQKEIENAEKSIKVVDDAAKAEGIKTECLVVGGRPFEAIVETAKNKNIDLIVVGSHGRTGLDRLLMGSVTERVVGHADCGVLVVKA